MSTPQNSHAMPGILRPLLSRFVRLPWLSAMIALASAAMVYLALVRAGFVPPLATLPAVILGSPEPVLPPLGTGQLNQRSLKSLLPPKVNPASLSLWVDKSQFKLTVLHNRQAVKSYRVVLGRSPLGDKRREGDNKTPEGSYRLRDRYPHPAWSKFLWLDYPNPQDWQEHFYDKLTGRLDWWATIGSEVGIHGVPEGQESKIDRGENWTWGCISLKNADIDEIYGAVQVGTVVVIVP